MMIKRERVESVIAGRRPDHPPVSFWHHFPPDQAAGQPAVDAHLAFLDAYDLDFLKVMNDHEFPRAGIGVVRSAADLRRLKPVAGDAEGFGGQLEVLRRLRQELGDDILTCTTIFNAWAVLRKLTAPPDPRHGPPKLNGGSDARDEAITRLLKEDRAAVKAGLEVIAASLAAFARACIEAGATGIFLSVRDDWVNTTENNPDTYDEMVRPGDLQILQAAAGAPFNVVHVCGKPQDLLAFAEYPAAVLNWADRSAGPSIAYARDRVKPAIAGGVDNLKTLPSGTPEDCAAEVRDALRQAKERPILITPGCTYDPDAVPPENLKAMVATARGG